MFGKVLLTLLVVGLAYGVIRSRMRREAVGDRSTPPPVGAGSARRFAWTFLGVLLLSSAVLGYWRWRAGEQVVTVRVIDTASGRSQIYRAHENDVGEHGFITLDGRRVVLAGVERMEVMAGGGGRQGDR